MIDQTNGSPSPRAALRAKLIEAVEENPDMPAPELADKIAKQLLSRHKSLVEAYLAMEARNILAYELRAHQSQIRNRIYSAISIPGGTPVEPMPEDRKETLYDRISQWREYDPTTKRAIVLMDMSYEQLDESAQHDAKNMATYGRKMILKQRLMAGMQPGEIVRDRYAEEDVAEMLTAINKDMASGKFKLNIKRMPALTERTTTNGRHIR